MELSWITANPLPWAFVVLASVLFYCLSIAIYRVFFHPLARVPGPFWWKISIWPTIWQCAHGKRHLDLLAAHKRYGPVVRIAPDMVSFDTGSSARVIYGPRHANVVKSDFHLTLDATVSAPSLFAIVDKEKHAFRRRVVLQAFTEKAMNDASEFYLRYTRILLDELNKKIGTGWGKVNISDYAIWWTVDVMADLSLGRSFKCLTEPTFRHGIPMMRNGARYTYWAGHLPFRKLVDYALAHPVLSRFGGQAAVDNKNYFDFCEAAIQERIQEEEDAIAAGLVDEKRRKDYIHYLLTAVDPETGQKLTHNELKSDASLLLAAGSDTISNAISGFMFYLGRHRSARERAVAEVRQRFSTADDIRQGPALNACVYLEACILEAMRMAPPVSPSPLERVTVADGIEIDGRWYPAGLTVGTCFYALNFSEAAHREPFAFRPERWIVGETPEDEVRRAKENFFPFSGGHRMCVGRHLATRNLKMLLATLLWHFDFREARHLESGEVSGEEGQSGLYEIEDALISITQGPVLELKARVIE
ncbi:cytochrome P450 [Hypomontagnella submonticulosa]|nr:cytochrome P450 [Hypomontagnella submonticulosa]